MGPFSVSSTSIVVAPGGRGVHVDGRNDVAVAFDSRSGKKLWSYRTGSPIWGAAGVTYTLDGKQYVLISSGNTIVAFGLPEK